MRIIKFSVILLVAFNSYSQDIVKKVLWNKIDNIAVQYANIKQDNFESISNENGEININPIGGTITISTVSYELLQVEQSNYLIKDTIILQPKIFNLNEVIINNSEKYVKMFNTVATEYASEPHIEKFFIRAIIRKNGQLYKIADLSGLVEKKVLFGTTKKEMPKKNYIINLENIRKIGIEFKKYDFEFFSLKIFLNIAVSGYLNPKKYKFDYFENENSKIYKIEAKPKDSIANKIKGHYFVNSDDNTFNEINTVNNNNQSEFQQIRNIKYRTIFFETRSKFKRNTKTHKYQLHQSILQYKTEVFNKKVKDIFDVTYVYTATPENNLTEVDNNINIDKDMFEINGEYDNNYWQNNEVLPLTDEIQNFINLINTKVEKPTFRTINNIK